MSVSSTSSFVTEVLATAGRLDSAADQDDIATKLNCFNKRADEIRAEVYDLLQRKYKDFHLHLAAALELKSRYEALQDDKQKIVSSVKTEVEAHVKSSSSEYKDMSTQLAEVNLMMTIMGRLVKINSALEEFNTALKAKNFLEATAKLDIVNTTLSETTTARDNEIKILQALKEDYEKKKTMLDTDMSRAWADLVSWSIKKEDTGKSKSNTSWDISLTINKTEENIEMVAGLLQALHNGNNLRSKLELFGQRFLEHIIEPMLTHEGLRVTVKDSTLSLKGVTSSPAKNGAFTVQQMASLLTETIMFLGSKLFAAEVADGKANSKICLMHLLGQSMSQRLITDQVIARCLKYSIPSTKAGLEAYSKTIPIVEGLQTFLVSSRLIDESETTLSDYVNDINVLFANKKCEETLEKARQLMKMDIHQTVKVGKEEQTSDGTSKKSEGKTGSSLETEGGLAAKTLKLPAISISVSTERVMELVYGTLSEACEGSESPEYSIQLFYSVRDVLQLYLEVVPRYHRDSLATLPQLAALHHNNCMYLSHHLLTLGHQFALKLPPPLCEGAASFVDLVPKLRRAGTDVFLEQMRKQKEQILECLSSAQGFANVSDKGNYVSAERAVKQVIHQLQRLSTVWVDTLSDIIYHKSIGTLLNSALTEIVDRVVELEDISSKDAGSLHGILAVLAEKSPSWFETEHSAGQVSEVLLHKFVPNWAKYKELLLILNSGLQDIGDRWANGKGPLAEAMGANEVKHLIRALFQNTDKRAKVLVTIK